MGSSRTPAVGFLFCLFKKLYDNWLGRLHFGPGFVLFWFNFVLFYASNITTVHYIFMHSINFTPHAVPRLPAVSSPTAQQPYSLFIFYFFIYNFLAAPLAECSLQVNDWVAIPYNTEYNLPIFKSKKRPVCLRNAVCPIFAGKRRMTTRPYE